MASSDHQIDKPQCGHPKRAGVAQMQARKALILITSLRGLKLPSQVFCIPNTHVLTQLVYMKLIVHFGVYPTTKSKVNLLNVFQY